MPMEHIERVENDFGRVKLLIVGTRIRVHDVVAAYVFGNSSVGWIAENFDISLAQVHAALSFYYDNKERIDREIAEDDAYAERVAIPAREYFDRLSTNIPR